MKEKKGSCLILKMIGTHVLATSRRSRFRVQTDTRSLQT